MIVPRLYPLLLLALLSPAQEPAPQGQEAPSAESRPPARPAEPKPYEKVVTKEFETQHGVFTLHRSKSKLLYEIPTRELGREFLWVTQMARSTQGVGYGGMGIGNRVVKWEQKDNRILLRSISYETVADPRNPISRSVQASNNDTIIMAFPVEAFSNEGAAVIDVTRLFSTEVAEFSPRRILRARGFDPSRSFLERARPYPTNVEVEATHTYTSPVDTPPAAAPPPAPAPAIFAGMRPGSATVVMHYSMVKLPEAPMQPRLHDPRAGYFSVRQVDYGVDEPRAPRRAYITRWRLEKKDPNARLSEPVKPIVFYVDPATPAKWIPYVKSGVQKWQPAFEAAGFLNAIQARDAPQDPDWSPEDARYSVIRWQASTIENAMGPHVHDPRTGEILEADIQMYHNVLNLLSHWYFTQVSPLDKRAQKLPLPDELMGKLVEYVVAHEVGHTLGLPHNMKASSLYPLEKVRDREWVRTMSHTPTLMDYSRFNYVAQPEDNIDVEDLIPKIGPYDRWIIEWGYKPIPQARSAEEERATLNAWIVQAQDKTPWLRFSTAKANGSDPGENTEAVGDADAVRATGLGLRNLKRVMDLLLSATRADGRTYDDLEEVYGRVLGQWVREINHVVALVGGFDSQQKNWGQEGVLFQAVPRERQIAAMKFLAANALQTPRFLVRQDILRRLEPVGALDRVRTAQRSVLSNLLSPQRFQRLVEQAAMDTQVAYRPEEFLADLQQAVFTELAAPAPAVDAWRRNLQRLYIEMLGDRLNGRSPASDEQRPQMRGALRAILADLGRALPRTVDRTTRLHLEDLRDQIARTLDPKFPLPAPAAPQVLPGQPSVESCWPDLLLAPEAALSPRAY